MNATHIVYQSEHGIHSRRFGQKLPKNAAPIGYGTPDGEIHLGEGITLTEDELAATKTALKVGGAVIRTGYGLYNRTDPPRQEIEELADVVSAFAKHRQGGYSEERVPWMLRIVLELSIDEFSQILGEAHGKLNGNKYTIMASRYQLDPVELIDWVLRNHAELTDEDVKKLFQGTGAERYNLGWWKALGIRASMHRKYYSSQATDWMYKVIGDLKKDAA